MRATVMYGAGDGDVRVDTVVAQEARAATLKLVPRS